MEEFYFIVWLGFRLLLIGLIGLFLISGLDNLFLDLASRVRRLARRHAGLSPTPRDLEAIPEKPIAVLIPAARATGVIGPMLEHTLRTLRYSRAQFFVGVCRDDADTRQEVTRLSEKHSSIVAMDLPLDLASGDAERLNHLYKKILYYEREQQVRYEIFAVHKADDLVHPWSFKYFNLLLPEARLVQLPLYALERTRLNGLSGILMDEWAERHGLESAARADWTGIAPVLDSGFALSSEAINFLAEQGRYNLFDVEASDFRARIGRQLASRPGAQIYLEEALEESKPLNSRTRNPALTRTLLAPVATYRLPPRTAAGVTALTAEALAGTALREPDLKGTWTPARTYFAWRDRKTPLLHVGAGLATVVALYAAGCWIQSLAQPDLAPPPLLEWDEPTATFLAITIGLGLSRMLFRSLSVGRLYGLAQGVLSLPRWAPAIGIHFAATALTLCTRRPASEASAWPRADEPVPMRARLGELLVNRNHISRDQLQEALLTQRDTDKPLGEILVQAGALHEEEVVATLATQNAEEAVEIDPYATPLEVIHMVPRSMSERYRIFPLCAEGETLLLATDIRHRDAFAEELSLLLGRPVEFRWTTSVDIDFAIERGYARAELHPVRLSERLGPRLLRDGVVTEDQLKQALRRQKRTNRKLGEVLIELQLIGQDALQQYIKEVEV